MFVYHKIVSHTLSQVFHFLSNYNQSVIHTCMTSAQEKMIVMDKSIESFINVYDILSFWKWLFLPVCVLIDIESSVPKSQQKQANLWYHTSITPNI